MKSKEVGSKRNLSTIAIMVGWGLTILAVIWQVAMKDAGYTHRLDEVEEEIEDLNTRVKTTEDFRIVISEQLTEIKTDVKWIKERLDQLNR